MDGDNSLALFENRPNEAREGVEDGDPLELLLKVTGTPRYLWLPHAGQEGEVFRLVYVVWDILKHA